MGTCEMCGTEGELVDAIVEGTMLSVCRKCSRHGRVVTVEKPVITEQRPKKIVIEEVSRYVIDNYAILVKKARERRDWKQEDLAHQINEKESVIHKIESGHMKPDMNLAQKLEKTLGIVLIVQYEEPKEKMVNLKDDALTIGDLVKLKGKI